MVQIPTFQAFGIHGLGYEETFEAEIAPTETSSVLFSLKNTDSGLGTAAEVLPTFLCRGE